MGMLFTFEFDFLGRKGNIEEHTPHLPDDHRIPDVQCKCMQHAVP
jgi:hypothetical protein